MSSWPEANKLGDAVTGMFKRASFFRAAPAAIAVAASQYQSPVDKILELRGKTDPKAMQIREWRNIADSKIQSVSFCRGLLAPDFASDGFRHGLDDRPFAG
jgi:hypothetical protein